MFATLGAVSAVVLGLLLTASTGPDLTQTIGRALLILGYGAFAVRILPLAARAVHAAPLRL